MIVHEKLDEMLISVLGPSEKLPDCGGWHVLSYHPQSHVNRKSSKSSGIDEEAGGIQATLHNGTLLDSSANGSWA